MPIDPTWIDSEISIVPFIYSVQVFCIGMQIFDDHLPKTIPNTKKAIDCLKFNNSKCKLDYLKNKKPKSIIFSKQTSKLRTQK